VGCERFKRWDVRGHRLKRPGGREERGGLIMPADVQQSESRHASRSRARCTAGCDLIAPAAAARVAEANTRPHCSAIARKDGLPPHIRRSRSVAMNWAGVRTGPTGISRDLVRPLGEHYGAELGVALIS
jgi:hypothetical protein